MSTAHVQRQSSSASQRADAHSTSPAPGSKVTRTSRSTPTISTTPLSLLRWTSQVSPPSTLRLPVIPPILAPSAALTTSDAHPAFPRSTDAPSTVAASA